jgi:hypothetical protein
MYHCAAGTYDKEAWVDRYNEARRATQREYAPSVQDIRDDLESLYQDFKGDVCMAMNRGTSESVDVEDESLSGAIYNLNEFLKSAGL